MNFSQIVAERRSYRALKKSLISKEIIDELVKTISLTPSCFNNQPWRLVFTKEEDNLKKLCSALSKNNDWAKEASLIITVFSKKELDCLLPDGREYYLFDSGMAVSSILYKAVEVGLVAHAIAGYDQKLVKEILHIPEEMTVITLVIIGKHEEEGVANLTEKQIEAEKNRPQRLPQQNFVYEEHL